MKKRWIATASIFSILAALFFSNDRDYKNELLASHNAERNAREMGSVIYDKTLDDFAQKHAEWMARKNSMTHSDLKINGYKYLGENIAMGYPNVDAVMAAWMNSKGHRANILNPNFTRVGFGVTSVNGVMWWCTVFGRPQGNDAIPVMISQPEGISPDN